MIHVGSLHSWFTNAKSRQQSISKMWNVEAGVLYQEKHGENPYILHYEMFSHQMLPGRNPGNIPPVAQWHMVGRFCHHWATVGFCLYYQQFFTFGPMVAFQPIFMSVEFTTSGPPVVFVQDGQKNPIKPHFYFGREGVNIVIGHIIILSMNYGISP